MATAQESRWVLGARSETGYVRTANEDRMGFIRTPNGDVYVVSDGMGGYRGGALAADLTVRTLQTALEQLPADPAAFAERLRAGFHAANQAVFERRDPGDPETRDMGATGVALVTRGARAMVAHVGDSRAYLASRGALRLLTRDHTRVQKMVDAGLLTPAQAVDHPDASKLDRAIGHDATVEVDVSGWIRLRRGDMVLLCSDGLSGYVDDTEIGRVLRARDSPQALADRLVDCALAKGGADNVTVQLVRLGPRPGDAPWLSGLGRPAVLGPASALASAVLVWSAGAPRLDAAEARATKLEEELATAREAYAALQQQTDRLARQLARADAATGAPAAAVPSVVPSAAPPAPASRTPPPTTSRTTPSPPPTASRAPAPTTAAPAQQAAAPRPSRPPAAPAKPQLRDAAADRAPPAPAQQAAAPPRVSPASDAPVPSTVPDP